MDRRFCMVERFSWVRDFFEDKRFFVDKRWFQSDSCNLSRFTTHESGRQGKTLQVCPPNTFISFNIRLLKILVFLIQLLWYYEKIPKSFSDGPSLIYVNVFVRSFSKIDDVKMVSVRYLWRPDLPSLFRSTAFRLPYASNGMISAFALIRSSLPRGSD